MRQNHIPQLKDKMAFEEWLKLKKERRSQRKTTRESATIYTIPVVVHVIHKGEPTGVGGNISDQQIISQINVLTEDFRRMNGDASETPAMFLPVAADVELEFTLAKQDPEGLPTTGIIRVNGGRAEWELSENYELKSLSYWPAEDYLNIWVTDISGVYLGYAQFPTSEEVEGLDDVSESRLTDGVVIDFKAFGSKEKYPPANLTNNYDLGRTATHEVGHFFGLRHIWGDDSGGCTESDYVDDTPNQGGSTNDCPVSNTESCNSIDMIQNFMDYTNDACMNLFTLGQKERIRAILDNSPRRASLRTSEGATAPVVVSNDLGIRTVINPKNFTCTGANVPSVQIRNYGDNFITSAEIAVYFDGEIQETASFSLNLSPLEIDEVTFNPIQITSSGEHAVEFEITAVNNTTDGKFSNNYVMKDLHVPETVAIPMRENFNAVPTAEIPAQWALINPDKKQTWRAINADNGESNNTSLYMNFFNYDAEGEYDTLLTPVFDLTNTPFALLSFARAYAPYPGLSNDGLIIKLSTDCGQTFDHTLYESFGEELATTSENLLFFSPSGSKDWKRECIFLEDFLGLSNIRIAFIARNGNGNNLYLDDVFLDTSDDASNLKDLSVSSLNRAALVYCQQTPEQVIVVKNQGCTVENEFLLTYQFDDGKVFSDTYFVDGGLMPGQAIDVVLPDRFFGAGQHSYTISLPEVNDNNVANDQLSGIFFISGAQDQIPIREDFEDFPNSDWVVINRQNASSWQTISTNRGTSLYINAETAGNNQEEWLISPILDFTAAREATLYFDLAYSYAEEAKDGLKILISRDCGLTYEDIAFNKFSEELNTGEFSEFPESDEDWSEIGIDISPYLGENDIRIAFIAISANGNNIFLDNIETFVTPHAVTGINQIYPNPSDDGIVNITFDLEEKETVQVAMYNTTGQILSEMTFTNTLNQTYTFDLSNQSQGIYLIKVVGESFSYVKRIMLRNNNDL